MHDEKDEYILGDYTSSYRMLPPPPPRLPVNDNLDEEDRVGRDVIRILALAALLCAIASTVWWVLGRYFA